MWCSAVGFTVTLILSMLAVPLAAEAQPPSKVPRIGFLMPLLTPERAHNLEAFRHRLRELGYIEGQNLILEYRFAEERFDRLPGLANELVGLPVDVILTAGNQTITAARQATKTIPIVMATSGDPVRQGFVESLARPGANVTGLTLQSPELSGKRLELLLEAVPKLSAVAVLLKSGNSLHTFVRKETEDAAQALKIKLQSVEIREPDELENAFVKMAKNRTSALVVPLEPMFNNQAGRIVTWQLSIGWRQCTARGYTSMPADSCPTEQTSSTPFGAPRLMSTRYSREPNQPLYLWSSR